MRIRHGLAVIFFWLLFSSSAHAEIYIGIGGGQSFGGSISGFDAEGRVCGFFFFIPLCNDFSYSGSSLDTDTATAVGGKIGFYSDNPQWDWLGFEFQYFQRDLDVSRQPWSAGGSNTTQLLPTNPFSGQAEWDIEIQTFGFLFMARIPHRVMVEKLNLSRWEPYAGLGFSINPIKVGQMRTYDNAGNLVGTSFASPGSATAIGFLGTFGLNFKLHERWKLYGEYKFSHIAFLGEDKAISGFDTGASGEGYGLDITVTENIFMFGLTYNFGTSTN